MKALVLLSDSVRWDFDARCIIGGPEVEAELLARVDDHLERQSRPPSELEKLLSVGIGHLLDLPFSGGYFKGK
jgi:hypothetical protein